MWLEVVMSEDEELLHEEWLRVRLEALRRGLAQLSPTTQSEYETLVTELEGQLQRNVREPLLVRRLLNEIEAISKCVAFELDVGQNDAAPQSPAEHSPVPVEKKQRRRDCPETLPCHHRSLRRKLRAGGASPEAP
jgi:hypothetical protein